MRRLTHLFNKCLLNTYLPSTVLDQGVGKMRVSYLVCKGLAFREGNRCKNHPWETVFSDLLRNMEERGTGMHPEEIRGGFLEEVKLSPLSFITIVSPCIWRSLSPCELWEDRVKVSGVLLGIPNPPY